jgi:hypothetical protein
MIVIHDRKTFIVQASGFNGQGDLNKDATGSTISNGREPRSGLDRVFSFKLGHITLMHNKCTANIQLLLELKTRPGVCPVS